MIHIPTVFILITLISLALGSAIRLASSSEPGSGLKQLSTALLLHGVGYGVVISSQWLGPNVIVLSQFLVAMFFVFAIKAIATFHQMHVPRFTYLALVASVVLSSVLYIDSIEMRILLSSPILALAELLVLKPLISRRPLTPGRGQDLVIATVLLNLLTLIYRTVVAAAGLIEISVPLDSDISQTVLYLTVLVGVVMFSIGFVLMAKERTDHLNRDLILKDKLTGLWNRRRIEEAGEAELRRHVRYGTPASLMVIDLDDFKAINDQFGHAAGDDVLKAVATACASLLRETDLLGRWGGEEFVVILPGTGVNDAMAIAERLRLAIEGIDTVSGRCSASIGVALCLSSDDWREWFRRADAALYSAKADGKNRSAFQLPIDLGSGTPSLLWSDLFATGIDELDADHRGIIAHANELLGRISSNYDKDDVLATLEVIERDMRAHFGREERLIERINPDKLLAHRTGHLAIIARLRFLTERFQSDALPFEALVQFIVFEMCGQHMASEDRQALRDIDPPMPRALAS